MLITYILFVTTVCGHRSLHIDNLNALSSLTPEYENIFKPHYVNKHGNHTKHDIHVTDNYGKFLKLSYEAIHPLDINILKTDHKIHKNNIESLLCHNDNENTITLRFKTNTIAVDYHHQIQSSLLDKNQKYYVTASHEWECINPQKQRYESIIRQITAIQIDDINPKQLILTTTHAQITDIFQHLRIEYTTNIGQHSHKFTPSNNRRRLSFWGTLTSLWHTITDSLKAIRDDVMTVINNINAIATDFIKYERGEPVDFSNEANYTWSWNANDTQPFYIENAVSCENCFATFNLTYKYILNIEDKQVKYLYIMVEGDTEIEVGIEGKATIATEWSIYTPQLPIPDLAIGVAGVVFGVYIQGQFAIGFAIGIDEFMYKIRCIGYIQKGIEYDASDGRKNYIDASHFSYQHQGPKMEFKSVNIRLYARASINLGVSFIGYLAFGIQPDFTLRFEKQNATSDCALYCTPSAGLTVFIRADLGELIPWTTVTFPLNVMQTDISDWGGCLSQLDVTQIQMEKKDVYDDDYYDANDGNDYRRRIMDIINVTDDAITYIDFSLANKHQFDEVYGWGRKGAHWWSNMSTIYHICNEYSMTCFEYEDVPILEPDVASLLISVDVDALIAIYQTQIEISPRNRWNLKNVSMYTNISCVTRHKLVYNADVSRINHIETYDVYMLEWFCDMDLMDIGINEERDLMHYDAWICMISLPKQLHAIQLGFEYRDIMLFDKTWCKVFQLTKKRGYMMDVYNIDWNTFEYPSKLWYGVIECMNETVSVELYFISYDNDKVSAVLSGVYKNSTKSTWYIEGHMDFREMSMNLSVLHWYEKGIWFKEGEFMFIGILNILHDGTITYYGSIANSGCIGFMFQGYLNLSQFDDDELYVDNDALIPTNNGNDAMVTVLLVIVAVLISVMFIWMLYQCKNKKQAMSSLKYELMNDNNL